MAEKTGKVNEEVAAEMSSLKAAEGGKSSKEESVEQLKNVFHWPPLESNPESMESYLYKVGLSKNWRFEEPIMILPEMLTPPNFNYKPVAAVACLQQKREVVEMVKDGEKQVKKGKKVNDGRPGSMDVKSSYYMKQTGTLDNACGIIACLHAIFNVKEVEAELDAGSILATFKEQVKTQTPAEKATSLENANEFKQVHREAAMQGQSNLAASQADVNHHFVAFVINEDNKLIELDGTKAGPALIPVIKDGKEVTDYKLTEEEFMPAVGAELMRRVTTGLVTESLNVLCLVKKE